MNNNENYNVLNPLGAWNSTRLYRAQVIYTQAVSLPAYISCPFVTYGGSLYYSTGFDVNNNELQPTQGLVPSQDPAWLLVNITGGGGGLPTITSPTGTILVTGTLQNPNIDLPQSVATTATPTFAGLNLTYTTQERSILKKMLSLFTTDDVQAVFNASIRTGVLTANRVVTIPDGDSVTVVATTAQTNQVVAYIGADGIQRFVNNGGGGLGAFLGTFFTYTYTYISTFGQFPLLFNLLDATSIIPSPPTGWLWSVDGGIEGTDYIFTTGKGKTTQNPQITFNVPPLLQQGYTLTLLPSNTAIPPVTYIPYSIQIPPQPLPLTTGTYYFNVYFTNPLGTPFKPYWTALPTDAFVFQATVSTYLKCSSVTLTVITTQPNVPTFTISATDFNAGNSVTSTLISATSFPASYLFKVQAYMFNSDGISTTLIEQFNDRTVPIGYFIPAFWIQNANLTAPTFDITSNQVGFQQNYQAGLSILFFGTTGQQVIWVAYPQVFTTPPLGLVVRNGEYTGDAEFVSVTPVIQTIAGQVYNIYGYIISYTGYYCLTSELYLEIIPNIDDEPDTNLLLKTKTNAVQATETPKIGFFKRLFGAKS